MFLIQSKSVSKATIPIKSRHLWKTSPNDKTGFHNINVTQIPIYFMESTLIQQVFIQILKQELNLLGNTQINKTEGKHVSLIYKGYYYRNQTDVT